MTKNLFTASYVEKETLLHKLNPLVKFFISFGFAVFIFTSSSLMYLLISLFGVILLSSYVGLRIRNYIKIIKITQIFIFFSFFSAFLRNTYPYAYRFFVFTISSSNLDLAITNSLKIITLAILFQVLFASTKIETILKSFESPHKQKNQRKNRFVNLIMISMLAIHFIPIIINEFIKLKNGEKNLAIKKHRFDFLTPIKNYISVLPPVFKNTLVESEKVSEQIDKSSYHEFFEANKN